MATTSRATISRRLRSRGEKKGREMRGDKSVKKKSVKVRGREGKQKQIPFSKYSTYITMLVREIAVTARREPRIITILLAK